jgi:hypothetical protein
MIATMMARRHIFDCCDSLSITPLIFSDALIFAATLLSPLFRHAFRCRQRHADRPLDALFRHYAIIDIRFHAADYFDFIFAAGHTGH